MTRQSPGWRSPRFAGDGGLDTATRGRAQVEAIFQAADLDYQHRRRLTACVHVAHPRQSPQGLDVGIR
jgi:hypothetical protein